MLKSTDPQGLNDAAFQLINAGQYAKALPFAQKAMKLAKRGTLTKGYATFNTGYALLNLGRCAQAVPYFRKALGEEPRKNAGDITPRIQAAQTCARGGSSGQGQSQSSGGDQGSSQGP